MLAPFAKYVCVFLTGFAVTYLLTPWVRKIAERRGVVDRPGERRSHTRPTARGGGVAVFAGVHAACLVALVVPWGKMVGGFDLQWWRWFFAASGMLLVLGLVDDVRGMRPWVKLGGQALVGSVLFFSGTHVGGIFGYELPWYLDYGVTLFWLLAAINAFNLIDGLDGLAVGLAITSALGLCGYFILTRTPGHTLVLLALLGACLAFLRFNFHPATIFLGDSGSMFLGLMLGAVALETFNKGPFLLSIALPLLVLGVPFFDTSLAIWRRSIRMLLPQGPAQAGQAGLMQADVEHLHHRLARAGLSVRRVALLLWTVNALLVLAGLSMMVAKQQAAGIFMLALLIGFYVVIRHVGGIELRDSATALLLGLQRPTPSRIWALVYPCWDMAWMAAAWAWALRLFPGPQGTLWNTWLLEVPLWVTPSFAALAAFRMYRVVWSRARANEALILGLALWSGLAVSMALALLLERDVNALTGLLRALTFATLSHPAIFCPRLRHLLKDALTPWLVAKRRAGKDSEKILLYGAGGRCRLFLRERFFPESRSLDAREIVGIVDEDPSLHARWAFGYKVLGGLEDLPGLVGDHRISGVVITALLKPETERALQALALEHRFRLTQWWLEEREAGQGKAEKGKLKAEN